MSVATIRQWHSYIGLFIAPSVLFFALTGALQVFSLHEADGDFTPLPIVEKLASVHKDQQFTMGHHHAKPKPEAGNPAPPKRANIDFHQLWPGRISQPFPWGGQTC